MNKVCLASLALAGLAFFSACRKQADIVDDSCMFPASLQVRFSPVVNGAPLVMDSVWYRNAAGDSFRVTEHKYYVSNFSLETDSGEKIDFPESYILVDGRNVQTRFVSDRLPKRTYTKVSFLLGVDSARNVSGAQTGDLEQSKGMFWDWNTGYIMAKTEGKSPQSTLVDSSFFYHIAGFSGKTSVLRTVTLELPTPLVVKPCSKVHTLYLQSELNSWFTGAAPFSIAEQSSVTSVGGQAAGIANNYSKGFSVVRVEQ